MTKDERCGRMSPSWRWIGFALWLGIAGCTTSLPTSVDQALYPAEVSGMRWGISVTDLDGRVIVEERADERFVPASTVKLLTTAAAFDAIQRGEMPAHISGPQFVLKPNEEKGPPDLVIIGWGDPTLIDGPACEARCLADLVQGLASRGVSKVRDVIADDRYFPHAPTPPGWSAEDRLFWFGTGVSALMVDENVLYLKVGPGDALGGATTTEWYAGEGYFRLQNDAVTVDEEAERRLRISRKPGSRDIRLYGEVPLNSRPRYLRLGIDQPTHHAAWRFAAALEAAGIETTGEISVRQRPATLSDEPQYIDGEKTTEKCDGPSAYPPSQDIDAATLGLSPVPMKDVLAVINKDSQNLYAETVLRHISRAQGAGSTDCGLLAVDAMLRRADVAATDYDLADGSGMSVYNRVTPQSITALLRYAARQPWGEDFRATLPAGGIDGSLERRFRETQLEGQIFAKTGTLSGVSALSGYMKTARGRTLVFSIIGNDRPHGVESGAPLIDAALLEIAARY